MADFFVSCPMHFEKTLIKEIESFWFLMMDLDGLPTRKTLPEFREEAGGVEFSTETHLGYQINFFTKMALRVLQRIHVFEARYFDQFEKGLYAVPLEKFLAPGLVRFQIESQKSRLFHETNLLEAAERVFKTMGFVHDKTSETTIMLRIIKDRVIVSLDTSGEHLHFRGYRKFQGEAPIRENLASLVLRVAEVQSVTPGKINIFDPYCGSGTILFESLLQNYPHFNRHHTFLDFKNVPALFKSPSWKNNFRWIKIPTGVKLLGIDHNEETIKKLRLNADLFTQAFFSPDLDVRCGDSELLGLEEIAKILGPGSTTVVTNPPYGIRAESKNVVKSIERLENIEAIQKIVVVHPEHWVFRFSKLRERVRTPLSNQGLSTFISVFRRGSAIVNT